MKLALITISILLLSSCVFCQFDPGAVQISLSGSNVTDEKDVFSLFNNAACLRQLTSREIGIFYSPSPFGLKEMANTFIAYNEPFTFGNIAIGAMYYGFDLYNELKISAGYSNSIYNEFSFGLALNLHSVNIRNYGSDLVFYINTGMRMKIIEEIYFGFTISNLNRATFGSEKNQIPSIIKTGLGYCPAGNILFAFAFEKESDYKENISLGIDYNIIDPISIRSGFSTSISKFSGGIGIHYSVFNLNYAFIYHNDLGITHQTDLIIRLE